MLRSAVGIRYLVCGFKLIMQPGIRRWVLIPMLINFIFFSLFIALGVSQTGNLLDELMSHLPDWLQWLNWLLWPLFSLAILMIGFYLSLLSANLVAAPFNGLLAEEVEQHLRGATAAENMSWRTFLQSIVPALYSEIRKIAYFVIRALPLLLLFVIPGINILAPLLWALFSAWMLALEYVDYPLSNHGLLFPRYCPLLRERRALAMGFGGGILLLSMIPIINFIAIPIAVAGATTLALEEKLLPAQQTKSGDAAHSPPISSA